MGIVGIAVVAGTERDYRLQGGRAQGGQRMVGGGDGVGAAGRDPGVGVWGGEGRTRGVR